VRTDVAAYPEAVTSTATRRTAAWQAEPGRPTWGLVLGDLLRLAALVSLVVAAVAHGWVGAALFAFVLGATMLPRVAGSASVLDVTYCASLLAAAWFAQLEVYRDVPGLDLATHALTTGVIAMVALEVLQRLGLATDARHARGSAAVTTVGLGAFVAVVWELLEAAGHTFIDPRIYVTYLDTVGDLAAGLLGSAVAAALVARGPRSAAGHR
jgi:hypothetical protein